ncbi:MAG: eCIS core domain-containing protein [Ginsengibacter sp.]
MQIAETKQSSNTVSQNGTANRSLFFQPKLIINQPNDVYEQEANAMAEKVMRMQNAPSKYPFKDAENPGFFAGNSGKKLDESTKKFFEPKFGYLFSDVKIHNDAVAAKSAESVNALAYTAGNNIVFNENQFSPRTENGRKLLAHELTHVIQQNKQSATAIQRQDKDTDNKKDNVDNDKLQITKRIELEPPQDKLASVANLPGAKKDDDKPHLGIDFAKTISANPPMYLMPDTYSLSFVYRNLNAKSWGSDDSDPLGLDLLHEPNFQLTLSPDPHNAQLYQAALTLINLHLRRNKNEFIEIGLGLQGGMSRPLNLWNVGASLQVEYHITSRFSLTAASSISGTPHSDISPADYSSVSLGTHGLDWSWSPIVVGMLWHLKE